MCGKIEEKITKPQQRVHNNKKRILFAKNFEDDFLHFVVL